MASKTQVCTSEKQKIASHFITRPGGISKEQSLLLKGIGILCIVLHNYSHNIRGAMKENEFFYFHGRAANYFYSVGHGNHLFLNLFSYWGHIGVALFVFLTAYGLTRKSLSRPDSLGHGLLGGAAFVGHRALKLWGLMAAAMVLYIIVNPIYNLLADGSFSVEWPDRGWWFLTLLNNPVDPWTHGRYFFGPWWYMGLALQLVALYRLAVHGRSAWWIVSIALISTALGLILSACNVDWHWMRYYKENFTGWMLPFAAGVLMARRNVVVSTPLALISLLLMVLASLNVYAWHLTPLLALLFLMGIALCIKKEWAAKPLAWVGRLSMYIFATHTIVRWMLQPCTTLDNFRYLWPAYLAAVLLLAWVCKQICKIYERQ